MHHCVTLHIPALTCCNQENVNFCSFYDVIPALQNFSTNEHFLQTTDDANPKVHCNAIRPGCYARETVVSCNDVTRNPHAPPRGNLSLLMQSSEVNAMHRPSRDDSQLATTPRHHQRYLGLSNCTLFSFSFRPLFLSSPLLFSLYPFNIVIIRNRVKWI
jgi:hypothetical protein